MSSPEYLAKLGGDPSMDPSVVTSKIKDELGSLTHSEVLSVDPACEDEVLFGGFPTLTNPAKSWIATLYVDGGSDPQDLAPTMMNLATVLVQAGFEGTIPTKA